MRRRNNLTDESWDNFPTVQKFLDEVARQETPLKPVDETILRSFLNLMSFLQQHRADNESHPTPVERKSSPLS